MKYTLIGVGVIFEEDGRIYYNEGDEWFPQVTTIEDAIQMMLDFENNLVGQRYS